MFVRQTCNFTCFCPATYISCSPVTPPLLDRASPPTIHRHSRPTSPTCCPAYPFASHTNPPLLSSAHSSRNTLHSAHKSYSSSALRMSDPPCSLIMN